MVSTHEQTRKLIGGLQRNSERNYGDVGASMGALALMVVCMLIGAAAWQLAIR
jgi:hypothetical protein